MFCSKCGTSMADNVEACPGCGAVVAAMPQTPPTPVFTPGGTAAAPQPALPPFQQYVPVQETDGKAVGSLILGILSIFPLGLLAAIPAIILGHISRSSIARSMGRLKGEGMALAGLIMGYCSIGLVLLIAAIVIPTVLRTMPGLKRTRMAANEAAAASTLHTINLAQSTYATRYPAKGYATDLSTLGPGPSGACPGGEGNAQHACLLDRIAGSSRCGDGVWCFKSGYMYLMTAACGSDGSCSDYAILATPITRGDTGNKSFCSTSDGIVRVGGLARIPGSVSVEACRLWPPLT